MTVPVFITARHAEIVSLCRRAGVRRLDLFGSALRQDFDETLSDLDFLVALDEQAPTKYFETYFSLKEGLEALFSRPVDLVIEHSIRNPYFRRQIDAERESVYVA